MMKKLLSLLLIYMFFVSTVLAKDLRFVQVTDVRYSVSSDNGTLDKVIKDIKQEKNVDFVVFTGDSLEKPDKENLEDFIKQTKKIKKPVYILIGDKDVNKHKELSKKQFMSVLKKRLHNYKESDTNYAFEKNGMVFLVADGAKDVIPSTIGYYKDNVLEWIDATLDLYQGKSVIILQHFPIVPPVDKENYMTYKSDKYLEILSKHKNVKAIVAGHFGVNKEETVSGITHISTAPAPFYRIIDVTDCNTQTPDIWAQVKKAE